MDAAAELVRTSFGGPLALYSPKRTHLSRTVIVQMSEM